MTQNFQEGLTRENINVKDFLQAICTVVMPNIMGLKVRKDFFVAISKKGQNGRLISPAFKV